MDCIDKYLEQYKNNSTHDVIYKLLKDKSKTKNLRDKIIIESFDNMYGKYEHNKEIFERLASKFNISVATAKYVIYNRCLVE